MLQANEIRIGNKVIGGDLYVGRILTVSEIYWVAEEHRKGYYVGVAEGANREYLEDVNGIPLTEALIKKCGFEKANLGKGIFRRDFTKFRTIFLKSEGLLFQVQVDGQAEQIDAGKPIQYVHQLQNIYQSLTGEDLPVKL